MKKNLDKNLISLKIRELREEKKLSQSEFSNEIGVSQQTISQIEKGIILPSLDVLSKITSNFCISYDSLLSESFANPNANLNANLNTEKEVQSNNVGPPDPCHQCEQEVLFLKEKIGLLEDKIKDKEQIIALLKKENNITEILGKMGVLQQGVTNIQSKSKPELSKK